jgi:hypothetical protein
MFHVKHFRLSFAFKEALLKGASGILRGEKNSGIPQFADSVQNDSPASAGVPNVIEHWDEPGE